MPTTRQIQSRLFPQSGMDSTSPPHLIADGKWLLMQGMRTQKGYLKQLDSLAVSSLTFPPGNTITRFDLIASPTGKQRTEQANCIFTDDGVYLMTSAITVVALKNKYTQAVFESNQDVGNSSVPGRTVVTPYANQLWFTSPKTQLCSTDGASVISYKPADDTGTFTVHYTVVNQYSSAIIGISTVLYNGQSATILLVKVTTNPYSNLSVDDQVSVTINGLYSPFYSRQYLVVAITRAPQSASSWIITLKTLDNQDLGQIQGNAFPTVQGTLTKNATGFNTITTPIRVTFTLATKYNKYIEGQAVTFSGLNFPNKLNSTFIISQVNGSSSFEFYMNDLSNPTAGNQVATCRSVFNDVVPSARFIENYYDHIIVANCTYNGSEEPWHVRWSNLYRPNDWNPRPESEADFYEVTSWQRSTPTINGITGMAKLRDVLYIYTDSCIIRCDYVGLPKVMQFRVVSENLGNFFYYGLIATKSHHYFFDATEQDFFEFDGVNPPKAIGGPILGFFLGLAVLDYRTDTDTQYLRGFHRPSTSEVVWTMSTLENWSVIYNYDSGVWYTQAGVNLLGGGGNAFNLIDQQTDTIDTVFTAVDESEPVGGPNVSIPLIMERNMVLYNITNTAAARFTYSAILETKDFTVDLQRYVEVDRITIHASYDEIPAIPTYYIQVEVSGRENLQDPVNYTFVGLWTKAGIPGGTLSFPAISGRIFRYRFVVSDGIENLKFYSFSDNVFNITAEK